MWTAPRANWAGVAIAAVVVFAIVVLAGEGGGAAPAPEIADEEPRRVGCTAGAEGLVTQGPESERAVALTFDDGPGMGTRPILRALRRHAASATFFVVGREVPGQEDVLRRMLRDGHEIGNHSSLHEPFPSRTDIAVTNRVVKRATGFRPCHFRPPGGEVDDALIAHARSLGLTTVTWNVDSRDWLDQRPAAIMDSVLATVGPGSIVLLHDSGGERFGTARVVSQIVERLKRLNYELVTVTELLGGRFETAPDPS